MVNMKGVPASWQAAKFADIQTFSDDRILLQVSSKWIAYNDYDYDLYLRNKGTISQPTGSGKDKERILCSLTLQNLLSIWKIEKRITKKRYKDLYKVGTVSTVGNL